MTAGTYLDRAMDLYGPQRAIEWVVERFAAPGMLTLLAGAPGSGKSQLALQLIEGVALGQPVCDLETAEGTALYLDAENGPTILRDRRREGDLELPARCCLDMSGVELHTASAQECLLATVQEAKATLVILDSLSRLSGPLRENDTDDMRRFVGQLASVARKTGAAIVVVHHRSTKNGSAPLRGSSAIEDQADIIFTITRQGQRRTLANTKMRPCAEWTRKLDLVLQTEPLRLITEGGAGEDLRDQVLEAVAAFGTLSDIADVVGVDLADEVARKRLNRCLVRLIELGKVERVARGVYALVDVPSMSA